jgi:5-methylcytosine-specific restriction endonuclease McrA
MSDTLVLDTLGFPVAFVSWQRAVNLQWQDRAVMVAEDATRILRSPSFEMGMPRVIKLRSHISRNLRLQVPMTCWNIAIRDNSSCQYCGVVLETAEYTIDHVLPRARGGNSVWRNLALACGQCNKRKSDRTPQEAGLTLRQKPVEPNQFDPRFNFRLRIHALRPDRKSTVRCAGNSGTSGSS